MAYRIFYYWFSDIIANIVWMRNKRSKCRQFKDSGLGSSYFCENIDLVLFLDFTVFVMRPDLFMREVLLALDLIDNGPLFV